MKSRIMRVRAGPGVSSRLPAHRHLLRLPKVRAGRPKMRRPTIIPSSATYFRSWSTSDTTATTGFTWQILVPVLSIPKSPHFTSLVQIEPIEVSRVTSREFPWWLYFLPSLLLQILEMWFIVKLVKVLQNSCLLYLLYCAFQLSQNDSSF